ncbi:phosphomannomutase [Oceaniglobus roseus]|uniref:phosphomannomutase n=1 Tax=Oceaniglobus roseus TaxID=1737570 RepID=UPI000C7EC43E|nr:phosphomannomutase [Kandeliimicrobium roseum]
MAAKFGTSGLRGLVTELTDEVCAAHVRAFLTVTPHDGVLLVGRDLRPSSPRHLAAVAVGAAALGVEVRDCGAVPTPALALEAARLGAPAVMVTGSHIPADRNGLKFYTRTGEITKADEAAILAALAPWEGAVTLSGVPAHEGVNARYVARFADSFGSAALSGLTVGLYEHSAVGRDVLHDILSALGATVRRLGRSETFIPVDTEAVDAGTREMLAGWAREGGLDALVSLDGDSDRPLLTDATGHVVPGDILGALTARSLSADCVVTPVSSNTMVEAMGLGEVMRTRIGSPYVIAGMEAALAADPAARVVGYEANGGFLLGFDAAGPAGQLAPLMTRDAVLPLLATLAQTREAGGVGALLGGLPQRRTAADRLQGLPTETSRAMIERLTADPRARAALLGEYGAEAGVDLTDGLRVAFESGEVVHLRPSGNAPELRCYAEAESEARAAEMVSSVLAAVRRDYG